MKKLIVLMLILAICAACFAGCGKNETSTTGGAESTGETTGTDASIGAAGNDETLSAEDLETLPDEGEIDVLFPEIDVDGDVDDDPVENTTDPADGTTEQEITQPVTDETTQPTEDDSNTGETIQNDNKATDPTWASDENDDFIVDFDQLIKSTEP